MKSFYLIRPYFIENRLLIVSGMVCLIAVDMLQLFIPRVLKLAVDDLTSFHTTRFDLLKYASAIIGFAVLIGIFRYGWRRCLMGLSRQIEEGLRNRLFNHIQTLSAPYFDRTSTGDLMAHATNDIQHIRMAAGMGLVAVIDAVVLGAAAIGFMSYIHFKLTLFVLIPMPMIVFSTKFFSKRMHLLYQEVQESFSDLTETVRETFAGIRIVKAFVREKAETERLKKISKEYIRKNLSLSGIIRSFFPLMLFFANLSMVIVLYFGGKQAVLFTITPGDFVAFISYLGLLTWPMMALGWVTNLIQRGGASLDRIDRIISTQPDIVDGGGCPAEKEIQNSITFEDACFSYPNNGTGEKPRVVLEQIRFVLKPGHILGIVGPPGSGKSTLLSLISRIYEVSSGVIRIGDIDIREMRLEDLRRRISFMPQESFLFADTIRNNILMGNSDTSERRLSETLERSCLKETISTFTHKLDTLVGEKGIILSGGQRQRVALARTFIKDASILIFDDPISQVDMDTGNSIIRKILELKGEKTVIIASHRISAVRYADRIIVLDQGRIAAEGSHEALLKNSAYYATTFSLQILEEEFHAF
jgi:ATP-binding cassette subfamily B protein